METRNTKQKEKIYEILLQKKNMIHPNINEIIEMISKVDKTIGQATIYRNINKLVNEGLLHKISTKDGYRYDVTTSIHGHLVCDQCGKVKDLFDENYQLVINDLQNKYHININNSDFVFDGICESCIK